MQIQKDTVVALRYIMRNGRGEVIDNIMQSTPINYLHGSTSILPSLQKQLEGLKAGCKMQVLLSKEANEADDDFMFDVIIDTVRQASSEEMLLGYPIQTVTDICNVDCTCYS